MDKSQARQPIRETFESPFDKDRFKAFVKNLLNTVEDAPFIYRDKFIPDAYDQFFVLVYPAEIWHLPANRIFLVAGSAVHPLQITAGFQVVHKTAQLETNLFSRTS